MHQTTCMVAALVEQATKNKASHLLMSLGGFGLVAVGILDSSVIPTFGSLDAFTIILAAAHKAWWWYYGLMAAAGSIIGAYLSCILGRKAGKEGLEKKFGEERLKKVYDYYSRKGFWAVFVPSILPPPFPTSPFLVSAGALNYSLRSYLIAVSIARTLRYAALAGLGALYGQWLLQFFKAHHRVLLIVATVLAISGGAAIGWHMWKQHKERKSGRGAARPEAKAA
jgi:membrane protein YqaA with SNARE-associated domain